MILRAGEVDMHAVVYLVEDTPDGPSRMAWCEVIERDGRRVFAGHALGDDVARELELPDDGRRVETLVADVVTPPTSAWKSGAWLVVDTETTGLRDACIVELGAVIMREGVVIEHRSALYRPDRPIEDGAAAVHGITNARVATRPQIRDRDPRTGRTPAEGLDALCAQHDVQAIVAYNGLTFDLPLLRRELGPRWREIEDAVGLVVDPLVVVRLDSVGRMWKGQGRHKLTAVADRLKLTEPEPGLQSVAHRAVWDCVLAGRILWRLRAHVPDDPAECRRLIEATGRQQREDLDAYWAARNGERR
jgi:DNA polymerase III epsilon subunit-like protein